MKKVLIALFAFAAIVAGLLLVAPMVIDWNSYRRDVAAAVAAATGRQITITGDLDVAVLPLPRLTVGQVGIGNIPGASDPDVLRIGELRMQLALDSLLKGRIAVRSLTLIDPELYLEATDDGRRSWDIAPALNREGTSGPVMPVPVESVSISNGRVVWRGTDGASRQLTAVTGSAMLTQPAGALEIRGRADFGALPLQFRATMGRSGGDGMAPASARVEIAGGAGAVNASGRINTDDLQAAGRIRFTTPDVAGLASTLRSGAPARLPAWSLTAESEFTSDARVATLSRLSITYGDIRATGDGTFELREMAALSAKIRVGTMDFDNLLAATAVARRDSGPSGDPIRAGNMRLLPDGITADLDFSVSVARWRGGIVRNVGLVLHLEPDSMEIRRLAARLPGGTDVALSGTATPTGQNPRLDGDLAVISDNLRGALVWAGAQKDRLPADRLRGFSYTSGITVVPDAIHLTGIAAQLDATRMSGAATIARRVRPAFGLRLKLDRLDLDSYLPRRLGAVGDTDAHALPGVSKFDANFNLSVGRLAIHGKSLSDVTVDARLFDGDLVLRELSVAELGGASLSATGTVNDLSGKPRADLEMAIEGSDAERFAGFMEIRPTAIMARLGRFSARTHAAGTVDGAAVRATLDIAGGDVRAEGTLAAGSEGGPAYALGVSVSHPDGDRFLDLFAPDRAHGGIGAMTASFSLSGNADALQIRNLEAVLADTRVAGRIDAILGADRPKVNAALSANLIDLARLWPPVPGRYSDASVPRPRGNARWSRESLDLSALRDVDIDLVIQSDALRRDRIRVESLDFRARLADGVVSIERLTGRLFGGDFEATGRIATTAVPSLTGEVSARHIAARPALAAIAAFDRLEGPLSLSLSLSTRGRNAFELLSSLSGHGTISGTLRAQRHGHQAIPAGPGGDAVLIMLNAFAGDPAALSGEFQVGGGTVQTGNLSLDGNHVSAQATGVIKLPDWQVDATTTLQRGGDAVSSPELVVRVGGYLNEPTVRVSGPAADIEAPDAPVPDAAPVIPVEPAALPPSDLGEAP